MSEAFFQLAAFQFVKSRPQGSSRSTNTKLSPSSRPQYWERSKNAARRRQASASGPLLAASAWSSAALTSVGTSGEEQSRCVMAGSRAGFTIGVSRVEGLPRPDGSTLESDSLPGPNVFAQELQLGRARIGDEGICEVPIPPTQHAEAARNRRHRSAGPFQASRLEHQ